MAKFLSILFVLVYGCYPPCIKVQFINNSRYNLGVYYLGKTLDSENRQKRDISQLVVTDVVLSKYSGGIMDCHEGFIWDMDRLEPDEKRYLLLVRLDDNYKPVQIEDTLIVTGEQIVNNRYRIFYDPDSLGERLRPAEY